LLPILALAALFVCLTILLSWPPVFAEALFFILLFSLHFLVVNKQNYNCTTASLITLHAIMESVRRDPGFSFVLLDNSDLFHMGRRAFFKEYGEALADKQLIFLELVGRGGHICLSYTKKAEPAAETMIRQGEGRVVPVSVDSRGEYSSIRVNCAAKGLWGYTIDNIQSPHDNRIDEQSLESVIHAIRRLFGK